MPIVVPDFLKSLQNEETRLSAELAELPIFRQLEAVRESLRKLAPAYDVGVIANFKQSNTGAAFTIVRARLGRTGSLSNIVSQAALDLFQKTGRRAKSSTIVDLLEAQGVKIDNKKPQAQVASILSHHPLIDNRGDARGSGYGLLSWTLEAQLSSHTEAQEKVPVGVVSRGRVAFVQRETASTKEEDAV